MLNEEYYKKLLIKYSIPPDNKTFLKLSYSIILNNYREKNVCFDFPINYDYSDLIEKLYEYLSKYIFKNFSDFPPETIKKVKKIGGSNKLIFKKDKYENEKVFLTNTIDKTFKVVVNYNGFLKKYIPVQKNLHKGALLDIKKYFSGVNDYGFLPTYFSKKIVLIAGQTIWKNLHDKKFISSIYLPITREGEHKQIKSIPALKDCIAYMTCKYETCYEELLNKKVSIDTILLCNANTDCLSQIINDQQKYGFKLIVLSNDDEIYDCNNTIWKWQKEEISAIDSSLSNHIDIIKIKDENINTLFKNFEDAKKYVSNLEVPINLKNYGYYLRLAFNSIQEETYDYALYRLKMNKELERNDGCYDFDYFGDNNPKEALKKFIQYLRDKKYKIKKIKQLWEDSKRELIIIADREDSDFLKDLLHTDKIITYKELKKRIKKGLSKKKTLLFYSFDGTKKDFNFIDSIPNNIKLLLYQQEYDLYIKQLQDHKVNIEKELSSEYRFSLCKIKYELIPEIPMKISPTLEEVIQKLDERSQVDYDIYKDENESLLDNDEQISYQITFSQSNPVEIENNDTVFDIKGNLIKSYRLKIGDIIRIYPKDQLAEDLFKIAVDTEPDKFGEIEKHSKDWQDILKELDNVIQDRESLYRELKKYGLKVLPNTVDSYFSGKRKFPMYYTDLKAIYSLADEVIPNENFVKDKFILIKKSKRLYNSTMIVLGRGIKQELKQFLKEKSIGEILQKKDFTIETLQKFVSKQMPLLTIIGIKEIEDE